MNWSMHVGAAGEKESTQRSNNTNGPSHCGKGHNTSEIKDNKMTNKIMNMYVTVRTEPILMTSGNSKGQRNKVKFQGLYTGTKCLFTIYDDISREFLSEVQVGDVVTINATMSTVNSHLKDFNGNYVLKDGLTRIKVKRQILTVNSWAHLFKYDDLVCPKKSPEPAPEPAPKPVVKPAPKPVVKPTPKKRPSVIKRTKGMPTKNTVTPEEVITVVHHLRFNWTREDRFYFKKKDVVRLLMGSRSTLPQRNSVTKAIGKLMVYGQVDQFPNDEQDHGAMEASYIMCCDEVPTWKLEY